MQRRAPARPIGPNAAHSPNPLMASSVGSPSMVPAAAGGGLIQVMQGGDRCGKMQS